MLGMITLISGKVMGQEKRSSNDEIGINTLQLLATTLDLSYDRAYKPWYSISLNTGYTFNFSYSLDIPGYLLSPHCKCDNRGYRMKKQSGGFLKAGVKFNLRSTLEKKNYFFLGTFISNSLVYERAGYENHETYPDHAVEVKHSVYIVGLNGMIGYHFRFSNTFNSDFGVQISKASNKSHDLYGDDNYIPGMGYYQNDHYKNTNLFPMLVLNLKYRLK